VNPAPLTLFGFVLALFLVWNNASYDRFWEGRKLNLLNTSRALTRQAMTWAIKK
jgi:putative membrane protein